MLNTRRTLLAVLILLQCAVPLTAVAKQDGCGGFDVAIRRHQYASHVTVDKAEACSLGHYHLTIKTPSGYISDFNTERDGWISGFWFETLKHSKEPVAVVWLQSVGSGSYGTLDIYLSDGQGHYALVKPAELPPSDNAYYEGHDLFWVRGGSIFRSFPRAQADDMARKKRSTESRTPFCKQTKKVLLRYDLQRKVWVDATQTPAR